MIKRFINSFILLSTIFTLTSCGGIVGESINKSSMGALSSITLSRTNISLTKGGTEQLVVTPVPKTASLQNLVWSTSDSSIATVNQDGLVRAVNTGNTIVTVTTEDGKIKADCAVIVQNKTIPVTGINLNMTNSTIESGDTLQLVSTITPIDATDQNVSWESSDTEIATVSSTGLVTAVSVGNATITATAHDGGFKADCNLTIIHFWGSVSVTGVNLNYTSSAINVGGNIQLNPAIIPSDSTNTNVTWSSDNTGVATVSSSGLVYGVSAGTAAITVTTDDGGFTATCNITVNTVNVPVTGVNLNYINSTIEVGGSIQLNPTISPLNATDKNVTWSSDDNGIATVSSTGLVTGVSAGNVKITVTTHDGDFKSDCDVTVTASTVDVSGINLNYTNATIDPGSTIQLDPSVYPANATNKNVIWSSDNNDAATVSSTGLVEGIAEGTAIITAATEDGGFEAECEITVTSTYIPVEGVTLDYTDATVDEGGSIQLNPTITPLNATNKNVIWYSSNSIIADVSSTGLVTALRPGNAVIYVQTEDGNYEATCNITVRSTAISVTGVSLNYTTATIEVDGTIQLIPTITPEDATNKNVTWTSSNNSRARVSSTGLVTGVAVYSNPVTITVKTADGNRIATCRITVIAKPVPVSGVSLNVNAITINNDGMVKAQLIPTILPSNATNKNVTWSSSNTDKASVSSSGLVTGLSLGNSTITVTTADGGFTAQCVVTLMEAISPGYNQLFPLPGNIGLNMKFVPGGTFPSGTGTYTLATETGANPATVPVPYWIAETETTYELWQAVYTWAISNGYSFANVGLMGDGMGDTILHPVSAVNWRDAMIWCNALTEYYNTNNGSEPDLDCVYYTDSSYTTPIRTSTNTRPGSIYAELPNADIPGSEDKPYIKAAVNGNTDMANCTAKGFRLPGSMEWECAAKYKDGTSWTAGNCLSGTDVDFVTNPTQESLDAISLFAWFDDNSSYTAHEVKTRNANALGIYDMSGNIGEWCFDWGVGWDNIPDVRVIRGGYWMFQNEDCQTGNASWSNPYSTGGPGVGDGIDGFRVARSY